MQTINTLIAASESLDLPLLIENSVLQTSGTYVDLQKDQMLHGLNSQGKPIGKYRNRAYAARKASMNPLAGEGNVDLKNTGSFYDDIFIDVRSDEIIVDSADTKSQALQNKYGTVVFGLDDDSKQQYVNQVQPVFVQLIADQLNKK